MRAEAPVLAEGRCVERLQAPAIDEQLGVGQQMRKRHRQGPRPHGRR